MGGPLTVVQIDECYMSGRRKKPRWTPSRWKHDVKPLRLYERRVFGLGVFGLDKKHSNGTTEVRMFHVLHRDEATLRLNYSGTEIWSDE